MTVMTGLIVGIALKSATVNTMLRPITRKNPAHTPVVNRMLRLNP